VALSVNLLAVLLALATRQGPTVWEPGPAPDGVAGLEARGRLAEVLALVRSRRDEDEAFLAEIEGLASSLQILVESTAGLYRARGLFQVLDPREPGDLASFHRRWREFQEAPAAFLALPNEEGRMWAKILCDTRIGMRCEILGGWEGDAREIRAGLALLRANASEWARLGEEVGAVVARRVDVAAALLRARIKDLSALRETPGDAAEVDEAQVGRILAALELPDAERDARLTEEIRLVEERAASMCDLLFLTRLTRTANARLQWRADLERRAQQAHDEALELSPDTPEGREARREIRSRKKTTRRREAFARAVEGLALDPFDERLTYLAGLEAEYVRGTYDLVDYYNRFLALRGIRVHDDRTWRGRELTDEEEHALAQIQQFESEPLPGTEEEEEPGPPEGG
jgi:hypothetical protein